MQATFSIAIGLLKIIDAFVTGTSKYLRHSNFNLHTIKAQNIKMGK